MFSGERTKAQSGEGWVGAGRGGSADLPSFGRRDPQCLISVASQPSD